MPEVCIVTKSWRSGIAWVVQELALAMAEAGSSVSLISPLADPEWRESHHPKLTRVVIARELVGQNTPIRRKMATARRIFEGLWAVFRQRLKTNTFIFTIPEPLIVTIPTFIILRLTRARILFLVHDAVPFHTWMFGKSLRWLEQGAHATSYRLANIVVVQTPALRNALMRDFGLSSSKIVIIPHGPFKIGKLPPPPGNGRLLLFGMFRSNKCVMDVIHGVRLARRSDPNLKLVLAGEPHPQELDYWANCRAAIAEDPSGFELQEGFVSDNDLPDIIARVDAFVLAYRDFESQSGVAVLAALSARPVLCTSSGGLADLISLGMCYEEIPIPVCSEGIAAAIEAFRARPFSDWLDRASKSAERLEQTMSWKTVGQMYLQIIRCQRLVSSP